LGFDVEYTSISAGNLSPLSSKYIRFISFLYSSSDNPSYSSCVILIRISSASITPSLMIFILFSITKFHRFYPFQRSFLVTFLMFILLFLFHFSIIYFIRYFYWSHLLLS